MPGSIGSGPPSALAIARIVRLALAGSVILYGVLAMLLRDQGEFRVDLPGSLQPVLHVVAGLLVLGGILVFRRLDAAATRPGDGAAPAARPMLPPRMIVGWALFESVGVLGLIVSLTGGSGQVLVLVSLVLILVHGPKAEWFPPAG